MTKMIQQGDLIGPYEAFTAREMLRRFRRLEESETEFFLKLGYLEYSEENELVLSLAGRKLCSARSKRFNRATGEKVLSEFMRRVDEANSNEDYFYFVEKVVLFGSMLSESDTIADVDIFALLTRKEKFLRVSNYSELALARAKSAGSNRKMSFIDSITFPEKEVWRFIQGRNPLLSLQEWNDKAKTFIAGKPHKTIYSWQESR